MNVRQGAVLKQPSERCEHAPSGPSTALRVSKVCNHHLDRLAIVYVRQSSPHQVAENRESRERQYALSEFAIQMGWPAERVLVIDEDQGLSGRFSENRHGFQRLLAEVSMNHVGLVLGLELSRLSRSSKDWHHLVEVCAVFDTLLGDQDGLYDASDSNDRLLLGLKGAMSEFELITLRNRLERGRDNKAQRGELVVAVPIGYLKLPTGEVVIEPDEQARAVVQLVFDKFRELGTAWRAFRYLRDNNIQMGFRRQRGPLRGQLEWHRATMRRVLRILHHPIYSGAYAYGMRGCGHKYTGHPKGGSTWFLPPDQIHVLIHDQFPAYITWEEYSGNLDKLEENRSQKKSKGSPRRGEALLSGLVYCGRCGRRIRAAYRKSKSPYYVCEGHLAEGREQACSGLKAKELDELVAQQVLLALQPASIELSMRAVRDLQQERERLHQHWHHQLERARHESQRIERQYQAVEPENRLVARTLESRWEESLRAEQQLCEEYDRFLAATPASLSEREIGKLRSIASDVNSLWHAPETTAADRKEIIRCLVERVVARVESHSEYVDVTIQWQGGFTSQHEIMRPVGAYSQLRDGARLMDRIRELHGQGMISDEIAATLNQEGFVPPRRKGGYSKRSLAPLLQKLGLVDEMRRAGLLEEGEWWVRDLARELKVTTQKIYYWARHGWVHARRTAQNHWIVWADQEELRRLDQLKVYHSSWIASRRPDLVTPKPRTTHGV